VLHGDDSFFALESCGVKVAGVDVVTKPGDEVISQCAVFGQGWFVILSGEIPDVFTAASVQLPNQTQELLRSLSGLFFDFPDVSASGSVAAWFNVETVSWFYG
jgi:hypothetical protein